MPILKQCSWNGCTKIVNSDIQYCDKHRVLYEKQNKIRFKEYRLKREDSRENSFYNTKLWKIVREEAIRRYFNIDVLEYYATGKIVPGTTVHHIVEVKEDWNMRIKMDNLICVTEANHRRIHHYYNKDIAHRKQMQSVLNGLVSKFKEEFGLDWEV